MTISVDDTSPSARILSINEVRLCQQATRALPSWFVIKADEDGVAYAYGIEKIYNPDLSGFVSVHKVINKIDLDTIDWEAWEIRREDYEAHLKTYRDANNKRIRILSLFTLNTLVSTFDEQQEKGFGMTFGNQFWHNRLADIVNDAREILAEAGEFEMEEFPEFDHSSHSVVASGERILDGARRLYANDTAVEPEKDVSLSPDALQAIKQSIAEIETGSLKSRDDVSSTAVDAPDTSPWMMSFERNAIFDVHDVSSLQIDTKPENDLFYPAILTTGKDGVRYGYWIGDEGFEEQEAALRVAQAKMGWALADLSQRAGWVSKSVTTIERLSPWMMSFEQGGIFNVHDVLHMYAHAKHERDPAGRDVFKPAIIAALKHNEQYACYWLGDDDIAVPVQSRVDDDWQVHNNKAEAERQAIHIAKQHMPVVLADFQRRLAGGV